MIVPGESKLDEQSAESLHRESKEQGEQAKQQSQSHQQDTASSNDLTEVQSENVRPEELKETHAHQIQQLEEEHEHQNDLLVEEQKLQSEAEQNTQLDLHKQLEQTSLEPAPKSKDSKEPASGHELNVSATVKPTLQVPKDNETPSSDRLEKTSSPVPQETTRPSNESVKREQAEIRRNSVLVPIAEDSVGAALNESGTSKISAYARLDFENFTFFVQTLQVVLGRKSNEELLHVSSHHAVDVHLSSKKAISRKHAKIFYNFGTQRFELSTLGRNGAFVDDNFIEKGITVPLKDGTKIQIGDISFQFVLPAVEVDDASVPSKQLNPSDALNLRSNMYNKAKISKRKLVKGRESPIPEESEVSKDPEHAKVDVEGIYAKSTKDSKVKIEKSDTSSKTQSQTANRSDILNQSSSPKAVKSENSPESPKQKSILSTSRRNSILKIRRLSSARRKSLASAASDEINDILKELGVTSIDAINEEEPGLLDSQIKLLLEENDVTDTSKLSYGESAIEDEDDDDLGDDDDDDIRLLGLDSEIESLGPLIDAHNQDLHELEEKKRDIESDRRKKRQQQRKNATARAKAAKEKQKEDEDNEGNPHFSQGPNSSQIGGTHSQLNTISNNGNNFLVGNSLSHQVSNTTRTTPLMGKPASIQPPNRLYNRTNGLTDRLARPNGSPVGQSGLSQMSNLPPQLQTGLPYQSGLSHSATNFAGLPPPMSQALQKPLIPPKPPKLEAHVLSMIAEPCAVRPRPPLRAITVSSRASMANFGVPKTIEEPSKFPKVPRRRNLLRQSKQMYTMDEIPEQFKSKPPMSLSSMISGVIKPAVNGLTLNELYDVLRDVYPYYKYCADGWQFSVAHHVKFNKIFKRKVKREGEWAFVMDEMFINEREKVRKKQQEWFAGRVEQNQRLANSQPPMSHGGYGMQRSNNYQTGGYSTGYGVGGSGMGIGIGAGTTPGNGTSGSPIPVGSPISSTSHFAGGAIQGSSSDSSSASGNKPKTIAELASEIRRDGSITKAPLYFKPQSTINTPQQGAESSPSVSPPLPANSTIKAQLAANRSQGSSFNNGTKKSLAYLQKELFTLYKSRKLSYNTATTTEIITKALATTIAQVNVIGAKAGCGENALSFLVERAPQQVSKILDIALSKSIKEKQVSLAKDSRSGSPSLSGDNKSSLAPVSVSANDGSSKTPSTTTSASTTGAQGQLNTTSDLGTPAPVTSVVSKSEDVTTVAADSTMSVNSSVPANASLNTPRPAAFNPVRPAHFGKSLSKPQSFAKPGSGLSNPPTFLSNKNQPASGEKRVSESIEDNARKVGRPDS